MMRFGTLVLLALVAWVAPVVGNDWYNWRGPEKNGISREKGLPESWNPDTGENVVWKNEKITGMSSPIIMGGRLYTWTRVGEAKFGSGDTVTTIVGPATQESLVCADADTGKILWEHRLNMYNTEVPFHRLGWGNVTGDPASGRVYGYGVQGTLICLDGKDGNVIWQRQMLEEFGMISTFGGRTQSPIVDEDQLLLTGVAFGWGDNAQGAHRVFAFDKNTGELRWTSGTGGRPVDAPMGTPMVQVVNGVRIVAMGAGDGGVYGFKARTGERVFGYKLSKRGINASVLWVGSKLIAGSSEESPDNAQLGRVVCLDIGQVDGKTLEPKLDWKIDGLEAGFASPTVEPDGTTVYMPDNKGTVYAIEMSTGKVAWKQATGTIGRPSMVWADGKIYAGEANGRFLIISPPEKGKKKAKVLSKVELAADAQQLGREYYMFGSPAIANGRVYLQTAGGTWCFGAKETVKEKVEPPALAAEEAAGEVAVVQVVPADVIIKSGEKATFKVRTYDAKGRFVAEASKADWGTEQLTIPVPPTAPAGTEPGKAGNLKGTVADGMYASEKGGMQAGAVAASVSVNGKIVKGFARVRVMPEPPYSIDFEAAPAKKPPLMWVNVGGKFQVRELEGGNKALTKTLDLDLYHLARAFFGRTELANYTVESDVMVGQQQVSGQRYQPDVGVVNSRYTLVLYGNHQQVMLIAWTGALPKEGQPGAAMNKAMEYKWEPNTWYRMKLTVKQEADGAKVSGKVWKRGEAEPAAWTLEMKDTMPSRSGAPGVFGESLVTPYKSEIYYDNIVVKPAE